MPSYKVLQKGFFGGKTYDPDGKRPVLHKDEPFPMKNKKEQLPTWLERIESETAAQKKKRLAAEAKSAEQAKAKKESDAKDIAEASFMGDGESANVEIL